MRKAYILDGGLINEICGDNGQTSIFKNDNYINDFYPQSVYAKEYFFKKSTTYTSVVKLGLSQGGVLDFQIKSRSLGSDVQDIRLLYNDRVLYTLSGYGGSIGWGISLVFVNNFIGIYVDPYTNNTSGSTNKTISGFLACGGIYINLNRIESITGEKLLEEAPPPPTPPVEGYDNLKIAILNDSFEVI